MSVAPFIAGDDRQDAVATEIRKACRQHGFFYVTDHGVDEDLQHRLVSVSRRFFELDLDEKLAIRMALAGRAWRGYFPIGEELTSGQPDHKEGIYFGAELDESDPRVMEGVPLHGPNLFPPGLPKMRQTVLHYMEAMTSLGRALMSGIALSLGLAPDYFERSMAEPFVLFRIFHYPPNPEAAGDQWGVGEHTDYGVLTILKQDETGGLQVKSAGKWVDAPPVDGAFVCNIGDMLEKMTHGAYVSTPHRVLNVSSRSRLSFPFFLDPSFDAKIEPINLPESEAGAMPRDSAQERWDGGNVHEFDGTYGDYLLAKVARVFPGLAESGRGEVGS